jgi:putative transposase
MVLGVATGASEAEVFWTEFLRSLADRGLRGVKLVIADDHKGLRAAARRVFNAGLQRCRVHWARNLLGHAAPKQRAAVAAMIRTIFAHRASADARSDSRRDGGQQTAEGTPNPRPLPSGTRSPTRSATGTTSSAP